MNLVARSGIRLEFNKRHLKIEEVSNEVTERKEWLQSVHGLVVLGTRRFLDTKTMQVIELPKVTE